MILTHWYWKPMVWSILASMRHIVICRMVQGETGLSAAGEERPALSSLSRPGHRKCCVIINLNPPRYLGDLGDNHLCGLTVASDNTSQPHWTHDGNVLTAQELSNSRISVVTVSVGKAQQLVLWPALSRHWATRSPILRDCTYSCTYTGMYNCTYTRLYIYVQSIHLFVQYMWVQYLKISVFKNFYISKL